MSLVVLYVHETKNKKVVHPRADYRIYYCNRRCDWICSFVCFDYREDTAVDEPGFCAELQPKPFTELWLSHEVRASIGLWLCQFTHWRCRFRNGHRDRCRYIGWSKIQALVLARAAGRHHFWYIVCPLVDISKCFCDRQIVPLLHRGVDGHDSVVPVCHFL